MIRRAAEVADAATRCHLLPALVEIELAAGDPGAARRGADELETIAGEYPKPMLCKSLPGCSVSGWQSGAVTWLGCDSPMVLPPHGAFAECACLDMSALAGSGIGSVYSAGLIRSMPTHAAGVAHYRPATP